MRNRLRSGNAIIETTFMMPWLLFLFVGVFDFGFYAYSLIAVQNAARAAAIHNSISKAAASDPDNSGCLVALSELLSTPNARGLTCPLSNPVSADTCTTNCTWLQVIPTLCSPNCSSGPFPNSADGKDAAQVEVKYRTALMIPIPGVLPGTLLIDKVAQVRINPSDD